MQPKERLRLEFTIEDALEQEGISKADVRVIDDLPLTFRGEVVTHSIRLFSRDEAARVEFETRIWREYLDFQPVARMMRQAFFDDVREHGLSRRRGRVWLRRDEISSCPEITWRFCRVFLGKK